MTAGVKNVARFLGIGRMDIGRDEVIQTTRRENIDVIKAVKKILPRTLVKDLPLQKLLDGWCKEQTGTATYYPCYKEYVKIDWSRYEKNRCL